MGPTGTPTEIPEGETVLLAGGGLGNAVLFSIAAAMKRDGNRVIYFAGYKRAGDSIQATRHRGRLRPGGMERRRGARRSRPAGRRTAAFVGNIVQAMDRYAAASSGRTPIRLPRSTASSAIGSDRMMDAVGQARHGVLGRCSAATTWPSARINSPMQCMMKEVCSQCLQRHVDPDTGRERLVFSCFNQDQPLDCVDFAHLDQRLRANHATEKMAELWLDHLLGRSPRPGA